ncbi:nuclear receptor interaction protein, putative [Ixodes scapularis]|uniref:Nuclear receptor interaction protein, putative n=1 Tax=Ixodes scapularis TaxID=6945 RepID=B7PZN8_IXOSC|nr:nuclear receptor interaction protein, putative [Ixodes scapularis]|eukprot:XP_002405755.1 nuclear receptor interaction protein, putative [Ixodes scapularis]
MHRRKGLFWKIEGSPYGYSTPYELFDAAKVTAVDTHIAKLFRSFLTFSGSRSFVQKLRLEVKLPVHNGCVNTICWNEAGTYILSGSDDQHLCITNAHTHTILAFIRTGHTANIFSAKFLPSSGDRLLVSCSGDGAILFSDVERPETSLRNLFSCHFGTAYEIATVPNDPHSFLSCGEDGTVRWFDLRTKTSCSTEECSEDVLINCHRAITSIAVNPLTPFHLAVGCSDSAVRVFDRRMLGTRTTGNYMSNSSDAMISRLVIPEFEGRSHRITSLTYSPNGREMLVSYSSDYVYLFDAEVRKIVAMIPQMFQSKQKEARLSMKRLRVRGDWSDTGPNARPECEMRALGEQQPRSLHASLMQRMSDVLTRMFNSSTTASSSRGRAAPSLSSSSSPSPVQSAGESSTDEDAEATVARHSRSLRQARPTRRLHMSQAVGSKQKTPLVSHASLPHGIGVPPNAKHDTLRHCTELMVRLHYGGRSSNSGINATENSASHTTPDVQGPRPPDRPEDDGNDNNDEDDDEDENVAFHDSVESISENECFQSAAENISPAHENGQGEPSSDDAISKATSSSHDHRQSHARSQSPPLSREASRFGRTLVLRAMAEDAQLEKDQVEELSCPRLVLGPSARRRYTGHRNSRTMIKEATFWGNDFVMSGSDCGHIFIWDKETCELVMIMEADHHVVNCLQPHPFDPVLASSGIDYDIKIWAPLKEEPFFDAEKAAEMIKRNEVMLEETKDTITVPASFMIRMLASLNHLRSAGSGVQGWRRLVREARTDDSDSSNH